jgi:hypothetical protein
MGAHADFKNRPPSKSEIKALNVLYAQILRRYSIPAHLRTQTGFRKITRAPAPTTT